MVVKSIYKNNVLVICLLVVFFSLVACEMPNNIKDNIPVLLSEIPVPDVEFGVPGKGFTCTGLTYDESEDVFYVGNIGKALPSTEGFKSTIVKLSKDGTTNLGEIKLYNTFPEMSDIQGITVDKSDDTLWFCSFAENKIRHISKEGADLSSVDINKPTGIAYDNRTDTLWVLTNLQLININKDGSIIESMDVEIEGQDQLFLDEDGEAIYFTAGINYKGDNFVYKIDLSTKEMNLEYTLKDSFAVEGIYIEDEIMYILNDGYYHDGKVDINQMNQYDISNLMTYKEYKNRNK